MGFTLLNNFTLLDAANLQGRRKTFTSNPDSVFDNDGTYSYTTFDVENSSVQPLSDRNQLLLEEGIREYEAYTVYTTTPLKTVQEATQELADQIYIDGLAGYNWYTVLKARKYSITSGGSQFEATVIKYPNT